MNSRRALGEKDEQTLVKVTDVSNLLVRSPGKLLQQVAEDIGSERPQAFPSFVWDAINARG